MTPGELAAAAATACAAAPHRVPLEARVEALLSAIARVRQRTHEPAARAALGAASGLSGPMVAWAIDSSVASITRERLLVLGERAGRGGRARPVTAAAVVLAGNVLTAPLRALLVPLLLGVPVIAKPSSGDDALVPLLAEALAATPLAGALALARFPGGSREHERALFGAVAVASVYGADEVIESVRARLPASVDLVAHGHGVGAAYVGPDALSDPARARAAAAALALDVVAYDQRGCLSPQVALVDGRGAVAAADFAAVLADALAAREAALPPGVPGQGARAAIHQWRGVAAATGALHEAPGWAVSLEDGPLRASPGHRHLQLVLVANAGAALARLAPLGRHLKALGASAGALAALADAMPLALAPRLSELGTMQTPPIDAAADGHPPWHGLVRVLDVQAGPALA